MIASTPCKVLCFPKRWLHELLEENDSMRVAAVELQLKNCWEVRRHYGTENANLKEELRVLTSSVYQEGETEFDNPEEDLAWDN